MLVSSDSMIALEKERSWYDDLVLATASIKTSKKQPLKSFSCREQRFRTSKFVSFSIKMINLAEITCTFCSLILILSPIKFIYFTWYLLTPQKRSQIPLLCFTMLASRAASSSFLWILPWKTSERKRVCSYQNQKFDQTEENLENIYSVDKSAGNWYPTSLL